MNPTPECCSVHTHSVLCDGKGTLAEMAAAAYAAGVRFFGASGHSHTEIPHDAGNVLPTDPAEYREQVLRLREEGPAGYRAGQPVRTAGSGLGGLLDRLRPQPL